MNIIIALSFLVFNLKKVESSYKRLQMPCSEHHNLKFIPHLQLREPEMPPARKPFLLDYVLQQASEQEWLIKYYEKKQA